MTYKKILLKSLTVIMAIMGVSLFAQVSAIGPADSDPDFNMGNGFNDNVISVATQADGKILVGGLFTTYSGTTANRIIRLNANGTIDTGFNIGGGFNHTSSNTVYTIKIQNDGKILVGGIIKQYNGSIINGIIRLNTDGTRDNTFQMGDGLDYGSARTIAIQNDGKILLGGSFATYGISSAKNIVRLNTDGTRDNTFQIGSGFSNIVSSIAIQDDGKIIIGGRFSSYNGVACGAGICKLNIDGTKDTSFTRGPFQTMVDGITIQSDGKIIVGGAFIKYKGVVANRIIRLYGDSLVSLPNSSDTGTMASSFTGKGYNQINGELVGSKSISLSDTNGNIPVVLNLRNNNIKLSLPANLQLKKANNTTNYSGILAPPSTKSVSSVAGAQVISAFTVGSSTESIKMTGGLATLSVLVSGKNIGDTVYVSYSENNGVNRYPQVKTTVVDVGGEPYAEFTTNHFTDFAITDFTGSFTINNDDATTPSTGVTLNISTTPAAAKMRFSNDGSSRSARENYATTKSWTLTGNYGNKTVYAQFDFDGDGTSDVQTNDSISYTDGLGACGAMGGNGEVCLSLEITATDGYCQYGKDLDLGQHAQTYSAFTMTGNFVNLSGNDIWFCDDTAGKAARTLDISASNLVTSNGAVYTISNNLIEMYATTPQKYNGGTNYTFDNGDFVNSWSNLATVKTVFAKTSAAGTIGKIGTDNVDIRVLVPANQEIGQYQSTITIQVPVMSI